MKSYKRHGFSLLESAALMMILSSLILGGVHLADSLLETRKLSAALEQALFENEVKPLRIKNDGGIELDKQALEIYLRVLIEKIKENTFNSESETNYLIEAAYAEIKIDPETGFSEGLALLPFSFSVSAGKLVVSPQDLQKQDFSGFFKKTAEKFPQQLHPDAVPTLTGFLPVIPVIAVRVFYDKNNIFAGKYFSDLSGDKVFTTSKVQVLRSEF